MPIILEKSTIRGFFLRLLPYEDPNNFVSEINCKNVRSVPRTTFTIVVRDYTRKRDISRRRDISKLRLGCNLHTFLYTATTFMMHYLPRLRSAVIFSPAAETHSPGSGNPDELIERKSGGECENAGGTCERGNVGAVA